MPLLLFRLALVLTTISFFSSPARAALLFYEGFGEEDYSEGDLNGQPFVGPGYAEGGTWNTTSTFETGGLTYPGIPTTEGFRLLRSAGEVQAPLNLSAEGPFGAAGLVSDINNKIGGEGIEASIYFSVLARKEQDGNGFAGFQIYDGGSEGFGVGQVTGGDAGAYKWLQANSNAPLGDPAIPWVVGETNLFIFKMDFASEVAPHIGTVWTNPDPALGEEEQEAAITTVVNNALPEAGFDVLRFRGNAVWSYDEVRIATTWDDVLGEAVVIVPLEITDISYEAETSVVSLTWRSQESATYTVRYSPDLSDWTNVLDNEVTAGPGETTSAEFDLGDAGLASEDVLFFRVEINE